MEYCFDDSIEVYAVQTVLADGRRRFYSVDLLPRIKQLLAGAAHGIDPDLSHWQVIGAYYGQVLQGAVLPAAWWDSFSLTYGRR